MSNAFARCRVVFAVNNCRRMIELRGGAFQYFQHYALSISKISTFLLSVVTIVSHRARRIPVKHECKNATSAGEWDSAIILAAAQSEYKVSVPSILEDKSCGHLRLRQSRRHNVLVTLPVDWCSHLMFGRELQGVSNAQHFIEVSAGGQADLSRVQLVSDFQAIS